jgi:hypothetical protein
MPSSDPRWRKLGQNFIWYVLTLIALLVLLRFFRNPVMLMALWAVGIMWGGVLAYKLSQIFFGANDLVFSDERSQSYLGQALDYQAKLDRVIRDAAAPTRQAYLEQLSEQVSALVKAIEALIDRMSSLRRDEVIERDLQSVPQAIKDLEKRLAEERDPAVRVQLERTLSNRRKQLESLQSLQSTIKRAEIQIESTLSQLGTIYSQILTGQSTSQVADYSRLSADVDEEVRLLQDHLEALREVKLGGA